MPPPSDRPERRSGRRLRFTRDEPGFTRVSNLSDGVFAIAMTLLVFTLDLGQLLEEPAGFPREQASGLLVFALAFALVANVWWGHLKTFAMLGFVETGMIVTNLALLGTVALVPYPTNLVGTFPTSLGAALTFIGLFVLLNLVDLAFVIQAQAVGAWDPPLAPRFYKWLVFQSVTGVAVLVIAGLLALWSPVLSLVVLGVSLVFGTLAVGLFGPDEG